MSTYSYQALDPSGKLIKGSLDAKNEAALVEKLQVQGYFPVHIEHFREAEEKSASLRGFLERRTSPRTLLDFTHELSVLLEAGLPLDRSLAILLKAEKNPAFKKIIETLRSGIQQGRPFAECLERHPEVFSEIYVSTIRAGEAGGALDTVLLRLRKFLEETQKLKDEIKSAVLYPLILVFAGSGAIALMLFFVIPKFAVIFEDMGAEIPLSTQVLLTASGALTSYWWAFVIFAALVFAAVNKKLKTKEGRLYFDRVKLRLPLVGPVIEKAVVSRFSRTLGTLLQGGLPVLEALNISVCTMGNSWMAGKMARVAEEVKKGRGLAAPLMEEDSFPDIAVNIFTVGEETGKLDEMLLRLADNYDQEIATSIKRLLTLLEPMIILFMALVIGSIVISLLMAVFSLNDIM